MDGSESNVSSVDAKSENAFQSLGLNNWIVEQCKALGMKKPTPIQQNCTPHILKGEDVIGCAKTGSGKTAAFALPILQKLSDDPYGIFCLVLTPTRELAFQISEQFTVLGKPIRAKVTVVTGGRVMYRDSDMVQQSIELAGQPHIVIATPGRLADHINSGTNFSLKRIRFLVLDEADRLLEDNFGEQLRAIYGHIAEKRQTLLFSATFTDSLKELEDVAQNKPFFWRETDPVMTVDTLDQRYVLAPADVKDAYLFRILDSYQEKNPNSLIIIFVQTCKFCQILAMVCKTLNFQCVALHSMIPQRQRLFSLAQFKSHQSKILIATDVASRGLDIPAVDLVINHNVPTKPKDYVHRVGRTARAGREGLAISMVTQFDIKLVHAVEEHVNKKLELYKVKEDEVTKIMTEVAMAKREAEISLDEQDFGEAKEINKRKRMILEGKDPDKEAKKKSKRKRDFEKRKRKKMKKSEEQSEETTA